jgi:hypothetical protein
MLLAVELELGKVIILITVKNCREQYEYPNSA